MSGGKTRDIAQAVLQIAESLLQTIQKASQSSFSERVRFFIQTDDCEDLSSKINAITKDFKQRLDLIRLKTSFEYPLIQALIRKQQSEKLDDFSDLTELNTAFTFSGQIELNFLVNDRFTHEFTRNSLSDRVNPYLLSNPSRGYFRHQ